MKCLLDGEAYATTTPYLYPTDSHRLAQAGATARTYDAAGNLTVIGGTTHVMTYAGHGRMATSTRGMQPTTAYAYNGLGEQVHRERGPLQRIALYDESGRWLGDYEGTGTPLQQFVWLDELPVGVLAGAGALQRLHYVQPDALGTPRVVIDPVRDVAVWRWGLEGEAFGNDAPEQDPDQDGVPFVFDMRFPGQRYDAASGLVQNYYREYEALTGRYTQSDPIGLAGGTATFVYATSAPLTSKDPDGLMEIRAWHMTVDGSLAWKFSFSFDPISPRDVPGWGGKVRRLVDRTAFALERSKPKAAGPQTEGFKEWLACRRLDSDLSKFFQNSGYNPNDRLGRDEARRILDSMFDEFPEARKYYPSTDAFLDGAVELSREHPMNKWREWIHGPAP